mmetsp:Transcript_50558/g.83799  ORF Transcript_50558/g.83799 Transcript_50558/m.83799 type:complete len:311 (+) Transcript_50558:527-1459(+)
MTRLTKPRSKARRWQCCTSTGTRCGRIADANCLTMVFWPRRSWHQKGMHPASTWLHLRWRWRRTTKRMKSTKRRRPMRSRWIPIHFLSTAFLPRSRLPAPTPSFQYRPTSSIRIICSLRDLANSRLSTPRRLRISRLVSSSRRCIRPSTSRFARSRITSRYSPLIEAVRRTLPSRFGMAQVRQLASPTRTHWLKRRSWWPCVPSPPSLLTYGSQTATLNRSSQKWVAMLRMITSRLPRPIACSRDTSTRNSQWATTRVLRALQRIVASLTPPLLLLRLRSEFPSGSGVSALLQTMLHALKRRSLLMVSTA